MPNTGQWAALAAVFWAAGMCAGSYVPFKLVEPWPARQEAAPCGPAHQRIPRQAAPR